MKDIMHYVLCKFNDTYQGEFAVQGYVAMELTEEHHNDFVVNVGALVHDSDYSTTISLSIDGEHELEYAVSSDFMDMVEFKEITKEQYDTLVELGLNEFGFTKFVDVIKEADDYFNYFDEEDGDEDYDDEDEDYDGDDEDEDYDGDDEDYDNANRDFLNSAINFNSDGDFNNDGDFGFRSIFDNGEDVVVEDDEDFFNVEPDEDDE